MNENKKNGISMSLYEMNQMIISQLPPYTIEQLNNLEDRINTWEQDFSSNKYFMLLSNDKHYYTIIHRISNGTADFTDLGQSIIELLKVCNYTILSDAIFNKDHCEIWIKDDQGTYVFLLFPYDEGVVTFG